MTWEYWLFLILAVAVLGGVFYFAMRKETPPSPRPAPREPSFQANKDNAQTPAADDTASVPPSSEDAAPASPQGTLPITPFSPPTLPAPTNDILSPGFCYEIRFYGEETLNAKDFAPLLEKLPGKACRLLGFNANGQWRHAPDSSCQYWLVALPLADRGGALMIDTIHHIEIAARTFAQKMKLHPVFPNATEVLKSADLIDKFCATVDMFIELRLVGTPNSAARIEEVMRIGGLAQDSERVYLCRVDSEVLFRVKLMPTPAGGAPRQTLIFEMDSPNVCNPPNAFAEMIQRLRRIAKVLDMSLRDPAGNAIDDERLHAMSRQLSSLTAQMREFGVTPGGALARLIFS